MFFIVDDEIPLRFTGSQVTLGLDANGDFALNPVRPACRIWRNALKDWMISPTGEVPVSINHARLTEAQKVLPSDTIRIGKYRIELRFLDQDEIITRAVQEKQFKL
jgi:hypothetical protein